MIIFFFHLSFSKELPHVDQKIRYGRNDGDYEGIWLISTNDSQAANRIAKRCELYSIKRSYKDAHAYYMYDLKIVNKPFISEKEIKEVENKLKNDPDIWNYGALTFHKPRKQLRTHLKRLKNSKK